jgi:selenide,water dikinase
LSLSFLLFFLLQGGLLISLPKDQAAAFCKEIEEIDKCPAWIIGDVVEGKKEAVLVENPTLIEV